MRKRLSMAVLAASVVAALAGTAAGGNGGTMEQAKAAGWDCNPEGLIFGYFHCAPPGKPSVADLINGTDVPVIVLRVFNPDGSFAGIERLIRADLYGGQPCPQDGGATWGGPLFGYYACHNFDT